jgi:hypothetical protein
MTKLKQNTYQDLIEVLEVLGLSEEVKKREIDGFESEVFEEFTERILRKLPEHEREGVAKLANEAAENGNKKTELTNKLTAWLNEDEVGRVWENATMTIVKEFLLNAFNEANEEQKKKLKEMFKPEVFAGY